MPFRTPNPMMMVRYGLTIACALAVACKDEPAAEGDGGSSTGETETGVAATDDPDTGTGVADESGAEETAAETTGGPELTRIEQVLQDVTIAMYECPDRVWPGAVLDNYHASQLLFVAQEEDGAWLWNDVAGNGDPPVVSMGTAAELPPEWLAFFNVGVLKGAPTVGISMDETATINEETEEVYVDFASVLAFHESFHFLGGQDSWPVGGGSRVLPYPEPWEPRYVRAELIAALRAILEDGADPGRARYWQDRWVTDFPDEAGDAAPYDVTEDSAEYAAIVSAALSKLGCDADEDAILAEAIAHLDDGFQGTGFTGGREFYDTGVLAGLALRRDAVGGWEAMTETGATPTEQLLSGVAPADQSDDAALQGEVQTAVAERNEMVGLEIDPMLADLASAEAYRIVVDFTWLEGSFGIGGFYYLADDPDQPEVWLRLDALFLPPGDAPIELIEETSLMFVSTPCAASASTSFVITLPVADVDVAGGLATSTAATATFEDLGVEVAVDTDGLEWLCPVASGGAQAPPPLPPLGSPTAGLHVVPRPDGSFLARP